jgi:ribosomal subunit interface protein
MHVLIRGERIKLGTELREYITRRLHFALGRFSPALERVSVRVGDVNGPRGGMDKQCHIRVELRASGGTPITAEVCEADLYAAVDRATDRIGRTVARTLDRQRRRRPRPRTAAPAKQADLVDRLPMTIGDDSREE